MPNEFTAIGEKRDDASEFLVLGSDGAYYAYDPAREHVVRTEPDERWALFPDAEGEDHRPLPDDS